MSSGHRGSVRVTPITVSASVEEQAPCMQGAPTVPAPVHASAHLATRRPRAHADIRPSAPIDPEPPAGNLAARGILIGAATGLVCWLLLGIAARGLWLWLAG